jgi:hypothetical protein
MPKHQPTAAVATATITVQVRQEVENQLRALAAKAGQTLENFVAELAEKAANQTGVSSSDTTPLATSQPLTAEEFERLLEELALGPSVKSLPADSSRADIYADHD